MAIYQFSKKVHFNTPLKLSFLLFLLNTIGCNSAIRSSQDRMGGKLAATKQNFFYQEDTDILLALYEAIWKLDEERVKGVLTQEEKGQRKAQELVNASLKGTKWAGMSPLYIVLKRRETLRKKPIGEGSAILLNIAELLLEAGALVNEEHDQEKTTVLQYAVQKKDTQMLKLLLGYDPFIRRTDKNGCSILHHAIKANDTEIVRLLIRHDPYMITLSNPNKRGLTPLLMAEQQGNKDIIQILSNPYKECVNCFIEPKVSSKKENYLYVKKDTNYPINHLILYKNALSWAYKSAAVVIEARLERPEPSKSDELGLVELVHLAEKNKQYSAVAKFLYTIKNKLKKENFKKYIRTEFIYDFYILPSRRVLIRGLLPVILEKVEERSLTHTMPALEVEGNTEKHIFSKSYENVTDFDSLINFVMELYC